MSIWNNYIKLVQENDRLSVDAKQRVIAAYEFLRGELGEHFLDKAVRGHAFNEKLFNKAPWQLEDMASLSEAMRKLKGQDSNYPALVRKLKSRDQSRAEGLPILELARMILDAGLLVKIEPSVDSSKKPDLEITDPRTGDVLFGELTVLNDSDDRNSKRDDHLFLFQIIETIDPYVHYGCKQKKKLNKEDEEMLFQFVQSCKRQVIENQSFEIFENDFIQVGFAIESKVEELKKWIEANDLSFDQVDGLELVQDEPKRIVNNKIPEKAKQIPEQFNGIIFIRVNPTLFMGDTLLQLIPLAQRELSKYPNIVGMIVLSFVGLVQQTAVLPLDGAFLSIKQVNQLSSRYTLFVLNKQVEVKISEDTLKLVFEMCLR